MNGNVSFRDALKNRLNIIQPTRKHIDEYNKIQGELITPGAKYVAGYKSPVDQ